MTKRMLAAAAAILFAGTAQAGVVTLEGVTTNGPTDFTFTYEWTLGPDEGLVSGDRLVIYDFLGYIAGSEFATPADVTASVELASPDRPISPGFDDDPTVANLVFTYTGEDFRTSGGPFAQFDFGGLGARSIFGGLGADGFFARSTSNNPDGQPGGSGSTVISLGAVTVPSVPEPGTWALMLGGFGLAGSAARKRKRIRQLLA